MIVTVLFILFICVVSRLVPHLANMTPFIALSLFAGKRLKPLTAVLLMGVSLLLSDFLLSRTLGYPMLGNWMWFTYSAIILITLFGQRYQYSRAKGLAVAGSACLGFWLWTNFGVFLLSGMYPLTLAGFSVCFIAAIPFLMHSLVGNLLWMVVLFEGLERCRPLISRA